MINLKIRVKIHPAKQHEFEQAVSHMLDFSQIVNKEFSFELTQTLEDKFVYLYSEEWDNRDNLNEHLKAEEFHALLGAMKVLGDIVDSKIIYATSEEKLAI